MPLKLSVRVGQSVAIGGPTTMRVEMKSGQVVGLVFDADRSVPIRIIPDGGDVAAPKPRGVAIGLGPGMQQDDPAASGLGRK